MALFAGAGGGILGGKMLGWRTVCAVEWEPYPASVLAARQNEGFLESFPIWDDVQTFDGRPWRGIVDVVSGGFPCQDISAAGKGAGIDGERSGMWGEMARIIYEVRPKFVFVENSPMLTSRGLGRVFGDLATMGFDAQWGVLGAADVGANHQRNRIWIVAKWSGQLSHAQHNRIGRWEQQQKSIEKEATKLANTKSARTRKNNNGLWQGVSGVNRGQKTENSEACTELANSGNERLQGSERIRDNNKKNIAGFEGAHGSTAECNPTYGTEADWWHIEPNVGRVADGVAARVDRLKAIGNGQVPLCAATAWRILNAP